MRVTASPDVNKSKPEDLPLYTALALTEIIQVINGNLSLADNFSGKILSIRFSTADVEVATPHGLGRVPSYYIQMGSTVATNIYDGSSANTAQLLYLRASVAATVRLVVF